MSTAREYLQNSLDSTHRNPVDLSEVPEMLKISQISPQASSSYTLATDNSALSRDVDNWIRGNVSPTETTGVQGSRIETIQRSTLATSRGDRTGFWYMLALTLPLYNRSQGQWRCTPSTILYTAEIFLLKLGRMFCGLGHTVRRLAHDQISREVFATLMDVVLVVYAIGFLILSVYQNTVAGVI